MDHKTRLQRLKFRAWHRGTKEADFALGRFVDAEMDSLSETDCDFLERLMDEQDADIMNWVTGREAVPDDLDTPLMARFLSLKHMSDTTGD